ncbi:MAG: hypothetical protein IPL63_14875 [Saprospiraceae bacterium]|nr:hypothetical protein [Saprospiraceae bacterium]
MSAYSNYRLSPNYRLDQTYTYKAIEGFDNSINLYPYTERADLATGLLDEMRKISTSKPSEQGMLYYKIGQINYKI